MTTAAALQPADRQILVNLGNRYAVFGPPGRREPIRFRPDTDSEILPHVEDEIEAAETRIIQTLRVAGMQTSVASAETSQADVELRDEDGTRTEVEIHVRERDPRQRDFEPAQQRLNRAARRGRALEIWYFNIERMKLVVVHLDRSGLRIDELVPLDVWERTAEGVFDRARVAEEADDWVHRVGALYDLVEAWLADRPDLRCERTRAVTLSDELMQRFAVAERDIPVLDVLDADEVVAAFIPRGLWLIGAWGRIEITTRARTHRLDALGGPGKVEWRLVLPEDSRKRIAFDKPALLALLAEH